MNEIDSFLAELGINPSTMPDNYQPSDIQQALDNSETPSISINDIEEAARETFDALLEQEDTPVTTEEVNQLLEDLDELTEEQTENSTEDKPELKTVEIYNEDSARFSGAEWFSAIKNVGVSIIGLGGIGSWLSLLLSRLKVAYIYGRDMDTVEPVNLAGQLYRTEDIGLLKTDAIRNLIWSFNDFRSQLYLHSSEFTTDSNIPRYSIYTDPYNVFLGLDSITARRSVYTWWKNTVSNKDKEFVLIDGRLTADKWQIFVIPSKDKKRMQTYEQEWLFPQNEAMHLPCSFKQTTYMAAMIASYMCNLFVNFVAESTKPLVPYSIPFMIEFDAQTLEMKTYEC